MNVDVEALVNELTNLYDRYKSKKLQNNIMICLDILKYYDFSEENNKIFAGYVLRILLVLKAKFEDDTDLTTDLTNLMAKGYTTGNMRSVFMKKGEKDKEIFDDEAEFYAERNFFNEEYERLELLIVRNGTKLIGSVSESLAGFNYEKTITNIIQLLDNQELVLRLETIILQILKPTGGHGKEKFTNKLEIIDGQLTATIMLKTDYLAKYNEYFNR